MIDYRSPIRFLVAIAVIGCLIGGVWGILCISYSGKSLIVKLDLGEDYSMKVYAENNWELTRGIYFKIEKGGMDYQDLQSWANMHPSVEEYGFKVIRDDAGKYVGIVEKSEPEGILLLYNKEENKIFTSIDEVSTNEAGVALRHLSNSGNLYFVILRENNNRVHKIWPH